MTYLLINVGILAGIFFISHQTNHLIISSVYTRTRSKSLAISLISLLLYPGVVIHEFSHLIMAVILFVPVKGMTLVPKITAENALQGGSVTIAKVDPIRRTLVGIAPLFVGITVLWLVTNYFLPPIPYICHSRESGNLSDQIDSGSKFGMTLYESFCNNGIQLTLYNPQLTTILAIYLIYSISTTMYSSKKDLDALLITVPLLILVGITAYILGFQIEWIMTFLNTMSKHFTHITTILVIPLFVQSVMWIVLKLMLLLVRR